MSAERGSSTVNVDPVPGVSRRHRAAQRIDDLLDDPETQADAAVVAGGRGPLEASEDAFVVVRRDAEAPIADCDDRPIVLGFQRHVDGLVVPVFDRVGHEVRDHLVEAALVPASDDRRRRANVERGPHAGGFVAEAGADLVDDLGEVDRLDVQLETPRGDARHVEQLVDQTVQTGRLRIDLLDLGDQAGRAAASAVPPRDP